MTIQKEGTTPIALSILFIFVINAAIQFYLPHANTIKWFIYILSFIAFVFVVLLFTIIKEGAPVLPAAVRNIFLSPTSKFDNDTNND